MTHQINALVELARSENDYITINFLQWFLTEQLEEVSSMDTLLKIVQRGAANLLSVEEYLARVGVKGAGPACRRLPWEARVGCQTQRQPSVPLSQAKRLQSFDRHAFREVARLVHVAAELDGEMVGEKLQRDDGQHRHHDIVRVGHGDDVVGDALQLRGAALGRDRDDRAFARADLLDVVQVLGKDGVIRRDEDRWQLRPDERDDAVLQLGARMALGEEIGDLFHLERRFERDRGN